MRRYWVQFRIMQGLHVVGMVETTVEREAPITCEDDIIEMAKTERPRLGDVPPGTDVVVAMWTPFEAPVATGSLH